jgi:MFS family permease
MDAEVFTIPCASLGFFVLLFGFIALMRYLHYRETVALAEKGLVRGDQMRGGNGKDTLRWGIAITAVGLALCIGLYPLGFIGSRSDFPLGFGPWMLVGLLPMFFGLGLVLIYVVTREDDKEKKPTAPPARLGLEALPEDDPSRPPQ